MPVSRLLPGPGRHQALRRMLHPQLLSGGLQAQTFRFPAATSISQPPLSAPASKAVAERELSQVWAVALTPAEAQRRPQLPETLSQNKSLSFKF